MIECIYYSILLKWTVTPWSTPIPVKPQETITRTHRIPWPALRVRVLTGQGQGQLGNTLGLPVPITSVNVAFYCKRWRLIEECWNISTGRSKNKDEERKLQDISTYLTICSVSLLGVSCMPVVQQSCLQGVFIILMSQWGRWQGDFKDVGDW